MLDPYFSNIFISRKKSQSHRESVCVCERERKREREGERKKRDEYQFVFIGNNDFFFFLLIQNSSAIRIREKQFRFFLKRKEGDTESMINRCSLFISFLFFSFHNIAVVWFWPFAYVMLMTRDPSSVAISVAACDTPTHMCVWKQREK